jgi:hypothetical protein
MSKPGQPPIHVDPAEQMAHLLDTHRASIEPRRLATLTDRVRELSLPFTPDELAVLAALNTPARVQHFLNTQIYYNNDHATPDTEETVMSPRQVLRTGRAHCFEGAMFAYAVNYLHGHGPRLVLLEASQDSEHNLVLYVDPQTGLFGCNAHSAYPHLDGRPAEYATIRPLAESYYPWYYSDRSNNPDDRTLVGYSEPFDLASKYGVEWMGRDDALWDIYYTYLDDTVMLHYLFDDSFASHLYPLVCALKDQWIEIDANGQSRVNTANLPPQALPLWHAFWSIYREEDRRPRGQAREIEQAFMRITNTTPIDLSENAGDFVYFLEKGYRVEQLLTRKA